VSSLAEFVDNAERRGQLNIHVDDIRATYPAMSEVALTHALMRLRRKGRIVQVSKGSGHWLVVPLQQADFGAPPVEAWLDSYLSGSLKLPYYLALLSAAEIHGSSPYAVMVTQVMVPKPRRRVELGRIVVDFHARSNIPAVPTQWYSTMHGRVLVSTPEMTACDLVEHQAQVGGIGRVRATLEGLYTAFTVRGLRRLLDADIPSPTLQRLGALLIEAKKLRLAKTLSIGLLRRPPVRVIPMELGAEITPKGDIDHSFKVWTPATLERSSA
jgi:predicted transcriptional regulator of viral defense system